MNIATFRYPLCTVIQITSIKLLDSRIINPKATTGHLSDEIMSATAARALNFESAIMAVHHGGSVSQNVARVCGISSGMIAFDRGRYATV